MENDQLNFEKVEIIISPTLVKEFLKLEELKTFIEDEKKYFDFLIQVSRSEGNLQSSINSISRVYDDASTKITNLIPNRATQKTVESTLAQIKKNLDSSYKSQLIFYSNSTEATYLKELSTTSPQVSGYAYTYLSGQQGNVPWTTHFALRGAIEAEFFIRGINDKSKAAVERALEEIRDKTQKHLDEYTEKENLL